MWTNKDPTAIGRLKNKETLKNLIPGLGKHGKGKIILYEDRIKKEREDRKLGKSDLAKDLLIKSIEYYKKNFKSTQIKIDLEKTLGENLDVLSESQLFEVNFILDFCHDPKDFDHPEIARMIVSIPDHSIMKRITVKLKKRIPAFKLRLELIKLETQESEIEKRKKELKNSIIKAQDAFRKRDIKSNKVKIKDIKEKNNQMICTESGCEKVCNTPAGLASHIRSAHKSKESQPLIPKSMKTNPNAKTIPGSKGTIIIS